MPITLESISQGIGAAGVPYNFSKASSVAEAAGTFQSMWKLAGVPIAGANPPLFSAGAGYIPTRATAGAIGQANPVSGEKYLASLQAMVTVAQTLIVYDRLWACSGFGTVVTTAQNVTTPGDLPAGRDPNAGLDVQPFIEVYTAPGATTATWTMTGVDSTGTSGRTWTYVHPANAETVGQMMPMTNGTAVGGCRQVTSFQCSATSGTAGDVGITLVRRLAMLGLATPNVSAAMDFYALGLPRVYDDACLAMMSLATTTSIGAVQGLIAIPNLTA